MNKEDAQAILKIIWMRDTLLDAGRCSDLRDRDCFTNRLLNQSRINWPATQIVLSLFLEISFTAVDYFR